MQQILFVHRLCESLEHNSLGLFQMYICLFPPVLHTSCIYLSLSLSHLLEFQLERKFNSQVYDLKDRLEQSHSTNRSMQNYVSFLKNSYANVFGDTSGMASSPYQPRSSAHTWCCGNFYIELKIISHKHVFIDKKRWTIVTEWTVLP